MTDNPATLDEGDENPGELQPVDEGAEDENPGPPEEIVDEEATEPHNEDDTDDDAGDDDSDQFTEEATP